MFVRAYLRASTKEQDANRARDSLEKFASDHNQVIASWYYENESGVKLDRPELMRLLSDARSGDILLIEHIDRLSRMEDSGWKKLKRMLDEKGVKIVVTSLPTSHRWLQADMVTDIHTERMLGIINDLLTDMAAAQANHDYELRRERQAQGVKKAKADGKYKGRAPDTAKRGKIRELLKANFSIRKAAELAGAAPSTVQSVRAEMKAEENDRLEAIISTTD